MTLPSNRARSNDTSGQLQGQPISPGVAWGAVLVAQVFHEVARAGSSHIVVVPALSAALVLPSFPAAGLVAERGGPLSAAATVMREAGIPVVVLSGATTRLTSGQRIIIDGTRGTIETLDWDD